LLKKFFIARLCNHNSKIDMTRVASKARYLICYVIEN